MIQDTDQATQAFRDLVLQALDYAAKEVFDQDHGWKDEDLPRLFKALDAHVKTLSVRYDYPLIDNLNAYMQTDKFKAEQECVKLHTTYYGSKAEQ